MAKVVVTCTQNIVHFSLFLIQAKNSVAKLMAGNGIRTGVGIFIFVRYNTFPFIVK